MVMNFFLKEMLLKSKNLTILKNVICVVSSIDKKYFQIYFYSRI